MTNKLTDPNTLRADQYQDSSNLSARADLHQHFSTNQVGWHTWVFNQFNFPKYSKILEVGSGPGYLWQQNKNSLIELDIYLADISNGMLEEARAALGNSGKFSYTAHDVCNLPFPDGVFDLVIANHMLYHVPDIPIALKEIRRVLKPDSCLYAATNGPDHLIEIKKWKSQFFPDQGQSDWGTPTLGFSLENGADLLKKEFKNVHLLEYPDCLEVDQVEPIIRYIRSYTILNESDSRTKRLHNFLHQKITEYGSIRITKDSGMFVATKH